MRKLIKFEELKVIEFARKRGLHTEFQASVYTMIDKSKKNSVSFSNFVRAYIKVYGDQYKPLIKEVYDKDTLVLGNPNTITYHYKYKTAEWTLYLKPYLKRRFIAVIGQLVANGCLGVLPVLNEK